MSFAEEKTIVSTSIEDLVELFRRIAGGGAKFEISVKLIDGGDHVSASDKRLTRPYDTSGRLNGYRGIADYLGSSVGFVVGMAQKGVIRTYKIGRKIYAYEDEVVEDLATASGSKAASRILKAKGYEQKKTWVPR